MLVPTDVPVNLPVTLTLVGASLRVGAARLVRLSAAELRLADPEFRPAPGDRVIVTVDERTRLSGKVLAIEPGGELRVSREGGRMVDDRSAPRVRAPLAVRYRLLEPGRANDPGWLAGGTHPGPFREFRGVAEISVSGMLLKDETSLPIGSHLAMELELDGQRLRVIGCVRRLHPVKGPVASGVEFVELGDDEAEALAAFTLSALGAEPSSG